MKLVKEMPKIGSFVAVWEYLDYIWSDTYQIYEEGGPLHIYDNTIDEFVTEGANLPEHATNIQFIIKD